MAKFFRFDFSNKYSQFSRLSQIAIRNFRNFRNLWNCDFRNFANNPIWFLGGIAISQITQFGFESFLQLWSSTRPFISAFDRSFQVPNAFILQSNSKNISWYQEWPSYNLWFTNIKKSSCSSSSRSRFCIMLFTCRKISCFLFSRFVP